MAAMPAGDAVSEARRRQLRRARWHRRRRWIGFLVFILVAAGVMAVAWSALSGGNDPKQVTATSVVVTTTPAIPPAGPFKVTDGVNVRTGPATSYPSVGTIDLGKEVMVTCVTTGESVTGPRGAVTTWVHVTASGVAGYVTSQYVATGTAIDDPHVIPPCAPA
jgi:hypothetical protein